jgi:hypothetical protein
MMAFLVFTYGAAIFLVVSVKNSGCIIRILCYIHSYIR